MHLTLHPERAWRLEQHLRHLSAEDWLPMWDDNGNVLDGISGMHGVRGYHVNRDTFIGADYVRMSPGSRFPLHSHDGDHEIYFVMGEGFVHINGEDIGVQAGHLIHIPAEYPHGIWVPETADFPLIFVAMGYPHKRVDAHDRMKSLSAE